jgi:aspartyl-tRNA(Asn)/glutamyl-tRNA(Gln) amidotransferase subunit C
MAETKPTISEEDVKKVARLARIKLTPDEVKKFQQELSSILEYVNQINEVDTSGVEFSSHTDLTNVYRKDTTEESLTREEATANREDSTKDGYFTIKSVLDHK